jgi:hypothetical protein
MSDAWIFLSIGDAGGRAKWIALDKLIAAADSNNHAIPTVGELEQSVSNLVAAGLVETRGLETRLTHRGVSAFREAQKLRVGHIERMLRVDEAWRARGYPPGAPKSWSVHPDSYARAYAEYCAWFERWDRFFAMPLGIGTVTGRVRQLLSRWRPPTDSN